MSSGSGFSIRPYVPSDLGALLEAWWRATRATHDFLTDDEIAGTRSEVARLIPYYETYVAADGLGSPFGLMSLDGNAVQLLFVHPERQGHGVGTALLAFARDRYGPLTVDVHEQNPLARAFYRRRGFHDVARWEIELPDRALPVIHMRQSENACM